MPTKKPARRSTRPAAASVPARAVKPAKRSSRPHILTSSERAAALQTIERLTQDDPSETFSVEEQQAIREGLRRLGLQPRPVPARLRALLQGGRHIRAGFPSPAKQELAREGALALKRRGRIVWRRPGKGGADLSHPPLEAANMALLRRFNADTEKAIRVCRLAPQREASAKGVAVRQAAAAVTRKEVLRLAQHYADRGSARTSLIVKTLRQSSTKITPQWVRQIIRSSGT
jgi:hypothetical protein